MSDTGVFGFATTPYDVECAVIALIKEWQGTYLRRMERKEGKPPHAYSNFKSFRSADSMTERYPEQQIPTLQISISDRITYDSEAENVSGLFEGDLELMVQANEPEAARRLSGIYAFMLSEMFLQQYHHLSPAITIGGFTLHDMSLAAVAAGKDRWLSMSKVGCSLLVKNMMQSQLGPVVPDEAEPENYPVSESTKLILLPEGE